METFIYQRKWLPYIVYKWLTCIVRQKIGHICIYFHLWPPSQTPKYGFSYIYIFLLNCPPPILYVRPIITTIIKKYIYTNLEKHIKMGKSAISPYNYPKSWKLHFFSVFIQYLDYFYQKYELYIYKKFKFTSPHCSEICINIKGQGVRSCWLAASDS